MRIPPIDHHPATNTFTIHLERALCDRSAHNCSHARLEAALPEGVAYAGGRIVVEQETPDTFTIAFRATRDGRPHLVLYQVDQVTGLPVPDTLGALQWTGAGPEDVLERSYRSPLPMLRIRALLTHYGVIA